MGTDEAEVWIRAAADALGGCRLRLRVCDPEPSLMNVLILGSRMASTQTLTSSDTSRVTVLPAFAVFRGIEFISFTSVTLLLFDQFLSITLYGYETISFCLFRMTRQRK